MFSFNQSDTLLFSLLYFLTLSTNASENEATTEQGIDVIEVHAQKRSQDLVDVAIAVSVIDGEAIDERFLKDSSELSALVPNVKITNNAGEGTPPAFNIRGIGMIDYNTSTISPIAVYSDGVVSGSANNIAVNLFDLERVEILRGPQGTLFGRNTTGGAILLTSKQPTDELEGYIRVGVAEQNHDRLAGAFNLPLNKTTAVRFAFNREDYQFSTNNLMPGAPDGGLRQNNFRVSLKSEFDDFIVKVKLHSEDWQGSPKPAATLGILKNGGGKCTPSEAGSSECHDAFGFQIDGDDFWNVVADTADKKHDSESWGVNANLAWTISDSVEVSSITGYKNLDRFHSWDSDGQGNFIEGSMGLDNTLMSQEFNLAYAKDDFHWVSGVYYVNEEIKQNNDIDLFRDFRTIPELSSVPAQFFYKNLLENTSFAIYSQLEQRLNETFSITAGLRYTKDETEYHANADLDIVPAYIPNLWDIKGKVDDNELSGKIALNQRINRLHSVYYSFSRGYKSGGYNAGYTTSPEQAVDSEYQAEKLNAYEVGSRHLFANNNGRLHLAAFYYDYQDQQVFVNMTTGVAPYHVLKNAGDSTIYGMDAELKFSLTSALEIELNLGYLPKANIGSYQDEGISVDDNRLPFTSKWNINGAILHQMSFLSGTLISELGFDFQSDFYFDQNENPYTEQKSFAVWHGRVTYYADNNLTLSLWGKNLTNTEHSELRFDSIAALAAVTELKAEARQLGIEVGYSF